jgi:transcriptional regulator with XRE-family HTH domain
MQNIHPRLGTVMAVSGLLADAAFLAARSAHRQVQKAMRPKRGQTLRPGNDTPLWNELVGALRGSLNKYGDKAKLGRYIGVPRQRIDDFLNGKRALPDAERTLLLLHWLDAKQRGIDLS